MKSKLILVILLLTAGQIGKAQVGNENIKVKKAKDGSNVYNFNFYNDKQKEKKNSSDVITRVKVPQKNSKSIKRGSGPQLEYFISDHFQYADEATVLGFENGYKLSYRLMHKEAGFYIAPGFAYSGIKVSSDEGSSTGYFIRFGGVSKGYKVFFMDYGFEYSEVKGEAFFYNSYDTGQDVEFSYYTSDYKARKYSLYISPSWKWGGFGLSLPIGIGVAHIDGDTVIESEGSGVFGENSITLPLDSKSHFYTFALSMGYSF